MKRTKKTRRPAAKPQKKTALVRQIVDAHLTQVAGGDDYDASISWPCFRRCRSCGGSPCSSSEA